MSSLTVSDAATGSGRERKLKNLKADEVSLLLTVLNTMSATTDLDAFRTEVSEDLLRLLKADFLASYIWDQESQVFGNFVGLNSDPANVERYMSYYQFHDPITPSLRARRKATLVREVMPQEELEKTEFFNDFLLKDGQHHGMNLHAYEGDLEIGDLRIWRTKKRPDFGDHEAALLDAILPHFRNALLNARTIARARGIEAFWTQLLENTHIGVLIFDETGRLVYRNKEIHAIERELSQGEYSSLCDFVRRTVKDCGVCTGWGPFSLSVLRTVRPQDARPVTVVMIYRPSSRTVTADLLRTRYNLTSREAEICILVYKGLTDREIANALGVAFTTIRTHLSRLFLKLDVSTRSELVYRLLEGVLDISF
ncbi:MAG: LuxR C-terminal-related transcriptional regulator [Syntrophorhabdales bacterium]